MDAIRVNKAELTSILETNMQQHSATVEKATAIFRQRVQEKLDDAIRTVKKGKPIGRDVLFIALPIPEDHTVDYERALGMLRLSLDDEIKLGEADYRRLVMDEWEWQNTFAANTTSYLAQ
jgi:hypothetical protein